MKHKYGSAWWTVEFGDNWKVEKDEDCATFTSKLGVGALQISAYCHDDKIINDEDLLDFSEDELEDELIEETSLNTVNFGNFTGFEISYFEDKSFWRKLWLRSGSLLLFITYNCAKDKHKIEIKDVNTILGSLCLK